MVVLFSGTFARAQDGPEALDKWNPPPPPPAAGLMDDGGLFQRNPSIAETIEDRLAGLNERHDFRIHLVVEPVIITSTPPDLAESLRLAWLPDGNGIVVVYETDTRSLGIGRRMTEDPAGEGPRVPTHVSAVIINEVIADTDKSLPSEEYLEALVTNLTTAFDDYFQRRAIGPPREQSWKLAWAVVAVAVALGLCAIGVAALARLKAVRGERTFHFHPVDRPERLQAPSGASVSSIKFRE
ncbi:MAG TPA: hypothetical protein VLO11_07265 [Luteolibacter sp.]|nr:hypothetical protein [Luteolibacter sp.]